MVYTGANLTLTGDVGQDNQPFALPPHNIDIFFTQAFVTAQPSSLQVNFMSDCGWTQIVFSFDIYDIVPNPKPSGFNLIQNQISFGVTTWNVSPVLQQSTLLIFTPVGSSPTPNVPVADFNNTPILVSDIMAGKYFFRVSLLAGTYEAMLINAATNAPVWFGNNNIPYSFNGVPKIVGVEYVGPTGGDAVTFTQGSIKVSIYGVQTHDSQANLIEPYPFKVIPSASPTFLYPNGITVQYSNETGEESNLSSAWSDATPSGQGSMKDITIITTITPTVTPIPAAAPTLAPKPVVNNKSIVSGIKRLLGRL